MDFAKISNYTIEIYFVLFYFGQRLYMKKMRKKLFRQKKSIIVCQLKKKKIVTRTLLSS
jgi:hypothetical protein